MRKGSHLASLITFVGLENQFFCGTESNDSAGYTNDKEKCHNCTAMTAHIVQAELSFSGGMCHKVHFSC